MLSRPNVVSIKTRLKVLKAVDILGYIPNSTAKNLRTSRTGKLLVTVPDISNPFFSLILQGIEDAAQRDDYAVLVGDTQHDDRREQRYALMLNSKEADGLIFLGHRLPKRPRRWPAPRRRAARRSSTAANSIRGSAFPSVHIDNARAASDAMHLLYDLGHRRIGVVTGPLVSPLSRDRLRGASTTAKKRGAGRPVVMDGDFSVESGSGAAQRLLAAPRPPTAIFCFNDEMAMGVLEYARQKRLRVPRDLSVVGFDDIRFARYTDPPLTTVAQPMRAIGEGTVRLLLAILNDDAATPDSVTLPHTLITRASTAAPPPR